MMQYITDRIKTAQFNGEMTVSLKISLFWTCDVRDDDCVSDYEFTDDETSDTSDYERKVVL